MPARLLSAQEYYKNFFNDQLVIAQPPWFHLFSLIELLYQLPLVLWGIWALATKSPRAPAHLLVWSVVCFGTTVTCIYEFYHHQMMSETQKTRLIAMYGLYALICMFSSHLIRRLKSTWISSCYCGCRYVLPHPENFGCRGFPRKREKTTLITVRLTAVASQTELHIIK